MRQDILDQQEQEANDMIAALNQQQPDDAVVTEQPAEPVEPQPVDDAPPAPTEMPDDFDPYSKPGEDVPPVDVKPEDFEHKYKVLQGMYNADVTRVRNENRQFREEIATLRGQVEELRRQQAQPQAPQEITDADVAGYSEFGPEIMDLARRNLTLERELASLREQVAGEVKNVRAEFQKCSEADFEAGMDRLLPNWRAQNQDNGFISWLQYLCPGTGRPWQEALGEAYQAKDAARTAAIFREYRRHVFEQTQGQAPLAPAAAAPTPGRARPAPAPASRGGASVAPQTPKYTLEDWNRLQDEAARGKWNHDPDGYRKREAEIHAAIFAM